ncbi:deoxyribodipyrimidine photolyase [Sphingomonas sp. Leaf407]|uniref:cryptochrome/photolyase family protein n=1 Tax=unclassified Sphingomonas TaxID=196159 RepID=UPI0006F71603|nr:MULTISPECIES: deoxyribodipyrimidine photo-lyase [unclassified Sphingomonas]KQN40729.1 deoxyribodipyrimidine photolyase [Sphingomonas sp. Leaf42]KQT30084.1 deoxyribodipyrimidine photolyase [Sphingomonas sp. Leaf407]
MTDSVLLWLRQDLRLRDHPALVAAAHAGAVIPVYVLDDDAPGDWRIGGAQRWWLHHSLTALDKALRDKGSRLILRRGDAVKELQVLLHETGAGEIHAMRHYEPWWVKAQDALGDRLTLHDGNHLRPPESVTTGSGGMFKIYSSFWKALNRMLPPDDPVAAPRSIPAPPKWPKSDKLADWTLLPTKPDWSTAFKAWTPGEDGAHAALKSFEDRVDDYDTARNLPSIDGSSNLSPHLHHGEISPRQVWAALDGSGDSLTTFRKELAWRDFASGVILSMPDYADANGRPRYDAMPWRTGAAAKRDLKAWQEGRTGYPIVDAGMRQLWQVGWMHNRVRMIAASFLIKHLLIDWREGERWYWDCLVDADYGNNAVNWQWVAGTGVDSNMFGRIMAPLTQSEKFDAAGYIRRWVPELKHLSDAQIHDPDAAGCRPKDYPEKRIDHREARERALAAAKGV